MKKAGEKEAGNDERSPEIRQKTYSFNLFAKGYRNDWKGMINLTLSNYFVEQRCHVMNNKQNALL